MRMRNSFLWILPFGAFFTGYSVTRFFVRQQPFPVPSVIGQQLQETAVQLSALRLNTRIITEKEDRDLPVGIIIHQVPEPGQQVKSHQTVSLVVTRRPPQPCAPSVTGLRVEAIIELLRDKNNEQPIELVSYYIKHELPAGVCCAQYPAPNKPLEKNKLIIYLSSGPETSVLFPSLIGLTKTRAEEIMKIQGLEAEFFHEYPVVPGHVCDSCTIQDQRPRAGVYIDLKKPPQIQCVLK